MLIILVVTIRLMMILRILMLIVVIMRSTVRSYKILVSLVLVPVYDMVLSVAAVHLTNSPWVCLMAPRPQ